MVPLRNATATSVADAIYSRWIAIFGIPNVIHSDRGTEFENELMTELCKLLGIRKSKSSPYYPQGDSMIERLFRTTKDMIYATSQSQNQGWEDVIPTVEMSLRSCVHESTKLTPFEVLFGMKMTTPFSKIAKQRDEYCPNDYVKNIRRDIWETQQLIRRKQKSYDTDTNKGIQHTFRVGDTVYARILPKQKGIDKPNYEGPFIIVDIKGEWCYVLKHCSTGRKIERNYYHVKACKNTEHELKTNRQTSIQSGKTAVKKISRNNQKITRRYPIRRRAEPERYGF